MAGPWTRTTRRLHLQGVPADDRRERFQTGSDTTRKVTRSVRPEPRPAGGRRRSAPGRRPAARSAPSALGDRRAGLVVAQVVGLQRDRHDRRRPHVAGHPLVVVDQLRQRRDRRAVGHVQVRAAGLVHQHQRVRGRAVQQAERDARVGGMADRALALDPEHGARSRPLAALQHQPLGGPGDEVGHHVVHGDAPAGDGDAGLAGGHEGAGAARAAAPPGRAPGRPSSCRWRSRVPTVATTCASTLEVAARSARRGPAGARRRSRISTPCVAAAAASSGSSPRKSCSPLSTSSPALDRLAGSPPASRRAACRRPARCRSAARSARSASASVDAGHHRHVRVEAGHVVAHACAGAGRVDHRHHLVGAVADHAGGGLGVVLGEAALGEDRDRGSRPRSSGFTPRPGRSLGSTRAVVEAEPLERVVGVQQVAVEVDDVDQRRQLRGRRDAELRLVHAAEHHRQAERAGGVDHAVRLADAARLGRA